MQITRFPLIKSGKQQSALGVELAALSLANLSHVFSVLISDWSESMHLAVITCWDSELREHAATLGSEVGSCTRFV